VTAVNIARDACHLVQRIIPAMKTPYGLQVIEDCIACPMLKDRMFCNLPPKALKNLDEISSSATYPKGAILFVEGQEPRGVFILCNGRVKLFGAAASGKAVIFRIAESGEIIGLPSTLSAKPYEVTAEALEPIQANFIKREAFLVYLREHGDAALRVAEMLSTIYYATCQEVRYLGFSSNAVEKLARFLLDLKPAKGAESGKDKVLLTLTHDEIASMIGSSRETVSRLFANFKRKKLIETHGSTIVLSNRKAIQELVDHG
jgi:CRP/FNR family transcriptional regulator, cyclic AMP receptor protein